jgi:hypothetical protein
MRFWNPRTAREKALCRSALKKITLYSPEGVQAFVDEMNGIARSITCWLGRPTVGLINKSEIDSQSELEIYRILGIIDCQNKKLSWDELKVYLELSEEELSKYLAFYRQPSEWHEKVFNISSEISAKKPLLIGDQYIECLRRGIIGEEISFHRFVATLMLHQVYVPTLSVINPANTL